MALNGVCRSQGPCILFEAKMRTLKKQVSFLKLKFYHTVPKVAANYHTMPKVAAGALLIKNTRTDRPRHTTHKSSHCPRGRGSSPLRKECLSLRPHSVNLKSTRTSPLTTQVQQGGEELPVCTEPLLADGFHRPSMTSPFTAHLYLRCRGPPGGCRAPGRGAKPRSMGGRSLAHAWLLVESMDLAVAGVVMSNVLCRQWLWVPAVSHDVPTNNVLVRVAVAWLSRCSNRLTGLAHASSSRFFKCRLRRHQRRVQPNTLDSLGHCARPLATWSLRLLSLQDRRTGRRGLPLRNSIAYICRST